LDRWRDPQKVWKRTQKALARDLRVSALVETNEPFEPARGGAREPGGRGEDSEEECCHVVHYGPLRIELEVDLSRPGLVVLCDQFYPGWRLDVETAGEQSRSVPILRANRVMRGAWLPPGSHRLVYRYRPGGFLWGAVITVFGWSFLGIARAGLSVAGRRSNRRRLVRRT
jgi:hypothetical protein